MLKIDLSERIHWFPITVSNDDAAILKEVNRGEEFALQKYETTLENIQVESPIYDKIVGQRNQVRTIFDRTKDLITIYEEG